MPPLSLPVRAGLLALIAAAALVVGPGPGMAQDRGETPLGVECAFQVDGRAEGLRISARVAPPRVRPVRPLDISASVDSGRAIPGRMDHFAARTTPFRIPHLRMEIPFSQTETLIINVAADGQAIAIPLDPVAKRLALERSRTGRCSDPSDLFAVWN